MFSVPIKGRSRCYSTLHCKETVEYSQRRENIIYRDWNCVVQLLLQLENKQQIMQNNVEAQHKHMYSFYIGSLCNVAFLMACFTCIVTSQVFMEFWMGWSIALSSAFYRGKKHLWIVFSFNELENKKNCVPLKQTEDF